tara:strand:- start:1265 stop:1582 length:318 start_codon:yes stop_codon:yes gene_type:complete
MKTKDKKVDSHALTWTYLDTFYKISNQVDVKSDLYTIDIIDEKELTQKHKDFFLEICKEAIDSNDDPIMELINDLILDYVVDNDAEIFAELEDMNVITNEDFLKD